MRVTWFHPRVREYLRYDRRDDDAIWRLRGTP
jgi:hypothetical protein